MQPDLDAFNACRRAVMHDSVADLRRHRLGDALLAAAAGDRRTVGVAEQHAEAHAGPCAVGQRAKEFDVFGEEEAAVGKYADLTLGRGEQPVPNLARNRGPVRVAGANLWAVRRAAVGDIGPQVPLMLADQALIIAP